MSSWIDVDWTAGVDAGGDETKLNNMADDLSFLRGNFDYQMVASCAHYSEGGAGPFVGASSSTPVRLGLYGPTGGIVTSSFTADGSQQQFGFSDDDLFGVGFDAVSEYTLTMEADAGGGAWNSIAELGRFWYVRTAEEDRLRIDGVIAVHANDWYRSQSLPALAGHLWGQVFGANVTAYRFGAGDSRWANVSFDGPSPGPAELVSDTDLNQMVTNADVVRDRTGVHYLGSSMCSDIGHALFWDGSLEADHALRFQLFVNGQEIGTVTTPYQPHNVWSSYEIKNRSNPVSGWANDVPVELRVQYANASSPSLFVGEDGVGSPGWLVAKTRFWQTPDDLFVHAFVAPRTWQSSTLFLAGDPQHVAFKTLGVGFIATRKALP